MADEADVAQTNYDQFHEQRLAEHRRQQEQRLKNLPLCENHPECENRVFVTHLGTIARFCQACWKELKILKT